MSDDDKLKPVSGDLAKPLRTEEIAWLRIFAGGAQPTELDIQRGIDAAMRGAVRDARSNPNALRAPEGVSMPGAVEQPKSRNGWQDAKPLAQPNKFETKLVDALAEKAVGGPNEPVK